eukprot:GHVP01038650.1.p1 GENE.GHVP01038650.1~~GHVP01038650.1.p1  ORF type:complete len:586 (-),score=92.70 GHVP01038650.1:1868-3439(-)
MGERAFSVDEVITTYHMEVGTTAEDAVSKICERKLSFKRPLWRVTYLMDKDSDERTKIVIQCHHCFTDGVAVNYLFQRNLFKNLKTDIEMSKILTRKTRIIAYITKIYYSSLDIIPLLITMSIKAYLKRRIINQQQNQINSKRLFSKHYHFDLEDVKKIKEPLAAIAGRKLTINDIFTSSVASVRSQFFKISEETKGLEKSSKFWVKDSLVGTSASSTPTSDSKFPTLVNMSPLKIQTKTPALLSSNTLSADFLNGSDRKSFSTAASTPTSTVDTDFPRSPIEESLSPTEFQSESTSKSNNRFPYLVSGLQEIGNLTKDTKHDIPITTLVVVNVRDKIPDSLDNAISPVLIDLPRPSYNEAHSQFIMDVLRSLGPLKQRARALVTKQMIETGFGLLPARISSQIMSQMSCNAEMLLSNLIGPTIEGYIGPAKLRDLKFWSPGKPPVDFTVSLCTFGDQTKISATVNDTASFDTAAFDRWKERQKLLGNTPDDRLPDILVQEIIHKMTGKICQFNFRDFNSCLI